MEFGMPTLLEAADLDACVALCKELGLNFIELNMNLPAYQADALDLERLGRLQNQEGIFFTFHLDENLNVCDFNRLVAEAYTATVLQTIEAAKRCSAPVLNLHMAKGVYFTLPVRRVFLFEQYRDGYLRALLQFRNACEAAIGDSGILLCVENTNGYPAFAREGISLLLESPAFALTLDTGHSLCAKFADEPFILSQGRLAHMHLHDATGGRDHLPLGGGDLPVERYLSLAKASDCRVVLETKTIDGLRESVHFLRRL
ncbi:MAG TPA: TIM barrel protein [Candidatus Aphodoplasma excrementigallinarum]|uniref:TIM barrel protein n=1 Tax=Candidatus Aphodoplasma excrementigallinarum TaxID=2840673 RepID=A0A9D1NHP5_9FIRM|nr:TIM barrel protein [Candidatus Aphodoplasma excrementigallinarum]